MAKKNISVLIWYQIIVDETRRLMRMKIGYVIVLVSVVVATCLLVYSFRENFLLQSRMSSLESKYTSLTKLYNENYNIGYQSGYDAGYDEGLIDGAERGYNIRDPTYEEMLEFIQLDQTDKNTYSAQTYTCFHFTADVKANAFAVGYRCGFVYVAFLTGAHAIVAFDTLDRGLIFIEPQDDQIVTLTIGQIYWDYPVVSFTIIW